MLWAFPREKAAGSGFPLQWRQKAAAISTAIPNARKSAAKANDADAANNK
jgi:hypothetical protein